MSRYIIIIIIVRYGRSQTTTVVCFYYSLSLYKYTIHIYIRRKHSPYSSHDENTIALCASHQMRDDVSTRATEGARERVTTHRHHFLCLFLFFSISISACSCKQWSSVCFIFLSFPRHTLVERFSRVSSSASRPAADLVFVQMRKYYFSKLAMRLYIDYFRFISMAVLMSVHFLFSSRKNEIFIIVFCIQTNIASLACHLATRMHAISQFCCWINILQKSTFCARLSGFWWVSYLRFGTELTFLRRVNMAEHPGMCRDSLPER